MSGAPPPERLPLKRIADIWLGKMIQPEASETATVAAPYLRAAHVQPGGRIVDVDDKTMWFSPKELAEHDLRAGDVVVVEGGAGYGRSAVLREDMEGWGFQNSILRVRPRPGRAVGRFIDYALQAALSSGETAIVCNTATIPHFTAEKVGALVVPAPEIRAQRAIADYLDREVGRIDSLVEAQAELIATLRERRRAVVDHHVWFGLDPDVGLAATGIDPAPTAPSHWRRLRNKNVLRERRTVSNDGQEELLTVSHLTGITPRSEKTVNMFEAESLDGYRVVARGDLVINTMWAWMGALGVSRHDGVVSPAYAVYAVRDGEGFDGGYFDYLYRSTPYITEMTRFSRGVWMSRLRLYPESFLRLGVVVPPLSEQRAIAEYLNDQTSAIDQLIARAEQFTAVANERRAALIADAVNGRLEIDDETAEAA